jgi:hypothetical protein
MKKFAVGCIVAVIALTAIAFGSVDGGESADVIRALVLGSGVASLIVCCALYLLADIRDRLTPR